MDIKAYITKSVRFENLERCTFQVPKMANGVYVLMSIFAPKMELYEKSTTEERLQKALVDYDGIKELSPIMIRYTIKGKKYNRLPRRKTFKTFDGFLKALKKEI